MRQMQPFLGRPRSPPFQAWDTYLWLGILGVRASPAPKMALSAARVNLQAEGPRALSLPRSRLSAVTPPHPSREAPRETSPQKFPSKAPLRDASNGCRAS